MVLDVVVQIRSRSFVEVIGASWPRHEAVTILRIRPPSGFLEWAADLS